MRGSIPIRDSSIGPTSGHVRIWGAGESLDVFQALINLPVSLGSVVSSDLPARFPLEIRYMLRPRAISIVSVDSRFPQMVSEIFLLVGQVWPLIHLGKVPQVAPVVLGPSVGSGFLPAGYSRQKAIPLPPLPYDRFRVYPSRQMFPVPCRW